MSNFTKILKTVLWKCSLVFLAFLLIFLLPLTMLISTPIFIYRLVIKILAKYFRPDFVKMISTSSSAFAQADSFDSPESTTIVQIIFDGTHNYKEFVKTFNSRMINAKDQNGKILYPEFQQYLVDWCGYKFWKPVQNFDINDHIIEEDTKEIMEQEDLVKIAEVLIKKPYDRNRSPWDFTLLQNVKTSNNKCDKNSALLIRFSHCLSDGYSMLNVLEGCADKAKTVRIQAKYPDKNIFQYLLFPFAFLYKLAEILILVSHFTPFKIARSQKTQKCTVDITKEIEIGEVKKIKDVHGTSFTSVVYAACTGAMRNMILNKGLHLPKNIVCLLPFPKPGHPQGLCNHFTYALMDFPVGEKDPAERLKICHNNYNNLKYSATPIVYSFIGKLWGSYCNSIGYYMGNDQTAGIISYFPVNLDTYSINGVAALNWSFYLGIQPGSSAASIGITGGANFLKATVVADSGFLPVEQAKDFVDLINDEIQVLMCEPPKQFSGITDEVSSKKE